MKGLQYDWLDLLVALGFFCLVMGIDMVIRWLLWRKR